MDNKIDISKEDFDNLRNEITEILPLFTPFEQDILCMRVGLNGGYSITLEEVERKFNISRELIRVIEMTAIWRMRRNNRIKHHHFENKNINNQIKNSHFQKEVLSILDSLTTQEQSIVKAKYGLDSGVELSDEDVLKKYSFMYLNQEQLTKIIEKVNRRIKHKPVEL